VLGVSHSWFVSYRHSIFPIFDALFYQPHKGGGSIADCILIKIFLLTYTYDPCIS
jgi:hypothetical protein